MKRFKSPRQVRSSCPFHDQVAIFSTFPRNKLSPSIIAPLALSFLDLDRDRRRTARSHDAAWIPKSTPPNRRAR